MLFISSCDRMDLDMEVMVVWLMFFLLSLRLFLIMGISGGVVNDDRKYVKNENYERWNVCMCGVVILEIFIVVVLCLEFMGRENLVVFGFFFVDCCMENVYMCFFFVMLCIDVFGLLLVYWLFIFEVDWFVIILNYYLNLIRYMFSVIVWKGWWWW